MHRKLNDAPRVAKISVKKALVKNLFRGGGTEDNITKALRFWVSFLGENFFNRSRLDKSADFFIGQSDQFEALK